MAKYDPKGKEDEEISISVEPLFYSIPLQGTDSDLVVGTGQ